jgi:hypothetical protein
MRRSLVEETLRLGPKFKVPYITTQIPVRIISGSAIPWIRRCAEDRAGSISDDGVGALSCRRIFLTIKILSAIHEAAGASQWESGNGGQFAAKRPSGLYIGVKFRVSWVLPTPVGPRKRKSQAVYRAGLGRTARAPRASIPGNVVILPLDSRREVWRVHFECHRSPGERQWADRCRR